MFRFSYHADDYLLRFESLSFERRLVLICRTLAFFGIRRLFLLCL